MPIFLILLPLNNFRYIILHAGNQNGFVEGASLLFKSGSNKGDYHGQMNSEVFEKWLRDELLPKLEEPSIIILDNASYHSRLFQRAPTSSSKKEDMKAWLRENNVNFPESASKNELYELIKPLTRSKSFVVDQIIQEAGHEILRLPPYHCHFNAIEMVWSQAKRFYDKHILKNKNVLDVWEQALKNVSSEQWAHYISHTDKIIRSAWEKFRITSDQEPVVITLNGSDESDYSSTEEDNM